MLSKELVKSIQAWLDLRVQLAGWQYWDTILQNRKAIYIVGASIFSIAISVIFLLLAAAWGLGLLFGHTIWGLLLIGVLMGMGAWIFCRLATRSINPKDEHIDRTITETNGTDRSEKETDE